MRNTMLVALLAAGFLSASCGSEADEQAAANPANQQTAEVSPDDIIALERGALDRWSRGDFSGYLDLYADEITYFDPTVEARLEGIDEMRASLQPMDADVEVSYEMIEPLVQIHGSVAVLTFQVLTSVRPEEGADAVETRWNCTEVYAQIDGAWKIVHNHWSLTKPELPGAA